MEKWIDRTTTAGLLGFSTLDLYLAVTYGVQGHVVRRQAAGIAA
ncbi:hypothetical protein [Streptomyces sp. NPDC054765]